MITKFEIFEKLKFPLFSKKEKEPQVGDFIVASGWENRNDDLPTEVKEFASNNIGQILIIRKREWLKYVVKYEDVPENLIGGFMYRLLSTGLHQDPVVCLLDMENILYWSKNKEDAEVYLNALKYNL